MCENKSHHTTAQNAVSIENNDRFTHHHSDLTLAGGREDPLREAGQIR
jgi:hypothetical protein